jgi:radical SAM-linked protein
MKLRIKFTKQGPVKFIGHLDIMRYFQKAVRRADIDIKYSEGYSPHQIMSFSSPLGLGLTSNAEYMDIEVNEIKSREDLIERLNKEMVEGIEVLECHELTDNAKNCMSLMAAADYTITIRPGKELADYNDFWNSIMDFYSQEQIIINKKTKKSEREVDLKPLIYDLHVDGEKLFMKVSSGSTDNLKPELVLEAYCRFLDIDYPEFTFMVQREEIYGNTGSETEVNLVPLGLIGEAVE